MKKLIYLLLPVCFLIGLTGCGCDNEIEADLVFVNQSDAVIVEVVVEFQDQSGGTRNADSSPLKRGESFGFEAGEYPATVYVYDKAVGKAGAGALARLTISKAPPEGERWYVTARDGAGRLELSADTQWPEGV